MPNRSSSPAVVSRLIVGVLVASLLGMLVSLYLTLSAQAALDRLQRATITTERYLSALKDVETAYRGFVIVGTDPYLEPYTDAKAELHRSSEAVADSLTLAGIGDGDAQRLLASGEALMEYAQLVIATRRSSWLEARALVTTGQGKALMDTARNAAHAAQVAARVDRERTNRRQSSLYIPALLVCLFGLLVTSAAFALYARRSRRSEARARTLLADVFERAPVGLATGRPESARGSVKPELRCDDWTRRSTCARTAARAGVPRRRPASASPRR